MTRQEKAAFWAEWNAALADILVTVDRHIIDSCELPLINHPLDVVTYTYILTDRREEREAGQVEAA